jgi:hypothetical protein
MENTAKTYNIMYNVGKVKYLISYNNGIKKHPDGSNFFDIETFKNKKLLNSFISQLEKD